MLVLFAVAVFFCLLDVADAILYALLNANCGVFCYSVYHRCDVLNSTHLKAPRLYSELFFALFPPSVMWVFCGGRVRQLGIPEPNERSSPEQNMLLLHTAAELAEKPEV